MDFDRARCCVYRDTMGQLFLVCMNIEYYERQEVADIKEVLLSSVVSPDVDSIDTNNFFQSI
jgi:hypothetical protein